MYLSCALHRMQMVCQALLEASDEVGCHNSCRVAPSEVCVPPAGIRIFCSEQRSQGQNRERAMALLRSRLYEMELEKQRAAESAKRKSQVGPGVTSHHRLKVE